MRARAQRGPAVPHSSRPGRGALLLVLLLAAPTARANGGAPPLPPGTTPYAGLPPYLFDGTRDPGARATWCAAMAAAGRVRTGTRTGGDLLFAAANACRSGQGEAAAALAWYAEAVAAYPGDDPTRGVVLLHHARRELGRGGVERAEALLARARAWLTQRPPADLDESDAARWGALRRLHDPADRLQADLHEANGRFAEAASVLEDLAGRTPDRVLAAALLERAAVLRHRAGDAAGAARAAQEAADASPDDAARARHVLWRLYQRHGLLTPDGALGLWSTWPGEDFEREVLTTLREVQGNVGAGPLYLAVASGAFAAGRTRTALAVYDLALRDNAFTASARRRPDLWRGLLVAFAAALECGALEDAERILDAVARIAEEPIGEMDAYRIALQGARAARAPPARSPAPAPKVREPPPATPLGRLETGAASPGAAEVAPRPRGSEAAGSVPKPVGLAVLALLAVLVGAGIRRRRRA